MSSGVYKRIIGINVGLNKGKHWKVKDTSKMGHTSWLKGKHLSEENKEKLRKIRLGTKHSEKTKKKMSEMRKGKKTYEMTDEIRKNMSLAKKGCIPWNKGKHFIDNWSEPYSVDWTRSLRIAIRERDYYTCQLCGKKQGDRAFSIHHIDYDKKNCNPENLITLCINCHQKTNFNRDKWISYFSNRLEKIICKK